MYQKNKPWDPLVDTESFVLTNPSDTYNLKATSGPFEVHQIIQSTDLGSSLQIGRVQAHSLVHHDVVFDFDLSAHVITEKLSPKWPKLQVLMDVSPRQQLPTTLGKSSKSGSRDVPRMWCGHIYARMNGYEESGICSLGDKLQACVASIILPQSWFYANGTLQIFYAFSHANQNKECATASNSIVPGRSFEMPLTTKRKSLTSFPLTWVRNEYDIKREERVLIYSPVDAFKPRAVFEVPIKLEANSDVHIFVIR